MVKKLKTIPRLTFIFIITLIISGSILTYFSINNISNFKELTQKKITEEDEILNIDLVNSDYYSYRVIANSAKNIMDKYGMKEIICNDFSEYLLNFQKNIHLLKWIHQLHYPLFLELMKVKD